MNKLGLGTAQFGLDYGVSNHSGKVKLSVAKKIILFARKQKIGLIDTAMNYGDSEKMLGKIDLSGFNIISKLPLPPKKTIFLKEWIENEFKLCLQRLNVKSLYALLIHDTKILMGEKGKIIIDALYNLKSRNLLKKIGVSIYNIEELELIMELMNINIVQAPLNIVDRRLDRSGWLLKLKKKNIEIHTRSVFLQGLLLLPRNKIPSKFNKWSKIWDFWQHELDRNDLDAKTVCLSYPLSFPEIDNVIIGTENENQLSEIVLASKEKIKNIDWSFMISNDEMLINPSNWKYI